MVKPNKCSYKNSTIINGIKNGGVQKKKFSDFNKDKQHLHNILKKDDKLPDNVVNAKNSVLKGTSLNKLELNPSKSLQQIKRVNIQPNSLLKDDNSRKQLKAISKKISTEKRKVGQDNDDDDPVLSRDVHNKLQKLKSNMNMTTSSSDDDMVTGSDDYDSDIDASDDLNDLEETEDDDDDATLQALQAKKKNETKVKPMKGPVELQKNVKPQNVLIQPVNKSEKLQSTQRISISKKAIANSGTSKSEVVDTNKNKMSVEVQENNDVRDKKQGKAKMKDKVSKNSQCTISLANQSRVMLEMGKRLQAVKSRSLYISPLSKNCSYLTIKQLVPALTALRLPAKHSKHKSKSFAFLEFDTPEDACNNIKEINDRLIDGHSVRVKPASGPGFQLHNTDDYNFKALFVSGLNFDVTQEDIHSLFVKCTSVDFPVLKGGSTLGFCYIYFKTEQDCLDAFDQLHGSVIKGHAINVTLVLKSKPISHDKNNHKSSKHQTVRHLAKSKKLVTNKSNNNTKLISMSTDILQNLSKMVQSGKLLANQNSAIKKPANSSELTQNGNDLKAPENKKLKFVEGHQLERICLKTTNTSPDDLCDSDD